MKTKRPAPELYLAFPKVIAALRDRISATEREIACWLFFDQIKAYGHVHELIDPPQISLMGIALTNWTQASKDSPPYLNALQGAYFLVSDIDNFSPPARYISFDDLVLRWLTHQATKEATVAFIHSRIDQDRLHDFAPGLGQTALSLTNFTSNFPHPPAEWAMFIYAEVEAIEKNDFSETGTHQPCQQTNLVEPSIRPRHPGKQKQQEEAILSAIRRQKVDPARIPKWSPNTSGIKAEVQSSFIIPGPLFQSVKTFDKAWERLRSGGEKAQIRDA